MAALLGPAVITAQSGTATAALADSAGSFMLRLTPGRYAVVASSLGYGAGEAAVTVAAGQSVRLELDLTVAALSLDPVVVTGTLRETRVPESPVKVDVVTGAYWTRRDGWC